MDKATPSKWVKHKPPSGFAVWECPMPEGYEPPKMEKGFTIPIIANIAYDDVITVGTDDGKWYCEVDGKPELGRFYATPPEQPSQPE